ncbi:hypothetical protein [Companilactobacillus sp. HBUAS59699]|uniref:hypothetical protein n=1 Tax=Companilactobacillus sp. HBUAS59699 TaxID=3109358 RepID=UPI002FF0BDDA
MKVSDFLNLILNTIVKVPAAIKVKKLDGTYVSVKAGDDMQADLSSAVYSKEEVDDKISKKIIDANNNSEISDSATLKKLQEMNEFLNSTQTE